MPSKGVVSIDFGSTYNFPRKILANIRSPKRKADGCQYRAARAHLAPELPDHQVRARRQLAALDEHGRERALPLVLPRLQDHGLRLAGDVSAQVHEVSLQQERLLQGLQALPRCGRHLHHLKIRKEHPENERIRRTG